MTRRRAVACVVLASSGLTLALAQDPGGKAAAPKLEPALAKVLTIWDRTAKTMRTLEVPFRVSRDSILRGRRVTSGSGTFSLRRDRAGRASVRWEFTKPRRRTGTDPLHQQT